jgi:hypothetical protein
MEEALYDTSKLIDIYMRKEPAYGYTTILNLIEFPKALELNVRVIYPSRSDYNLALKLSTELLRKGKPVPAVDSTIAAIALNRGLRVITKDRHFLTIKEVERDLKVSVEG